MKKWFLLSLAFLTPTFSTLLSMNQKQKAPFFLHANLVDNYTNRIAKEHNLTDTQKIEYKQNIQKWYFQGMKIDAEIQAQKKSTLDLREHLLHIRSLTWAWYCMSLRKCKCAQKEGSIKIDISKDDPQELMAQFFIDCIWLLLKEIPEHERSKYLIPCSAPGSHPQEKSISYHQIPLKDLPNYANYILVGVDKNNKKLLIRFDKNNRDASLSSLYSNPMECAKNLWGGIKSRIRKTSTVGEQYLGKDNEGPLNQISLPKEIEELYQEACPGKPKPYMYQAFQDAKKKRAENDVANTLYEVIMKKYSHPNDLYGDEFPVIDKNILQTCETYYAAIVQEGSKHIDYFYSCIEPLFELDNLLFHYNHQDLSNQTQERYTKSLETDLAAIEAQVTHIISEQYIKLIAQFPQEMPDYFKKHFTTIITILQQIKQSKKKTKHLKEDHFFEFDEHAVIIKSLQAEIETPKKLSTNNTIDFKAQTDDTSPLKQRNNNDDIFVYQTLAKEIFREVEDKKQHDSPRSSLSSANSWIIEDPLSSNQTVAKTAPSSPEPTIYPVAIEIKLDKKSEKKEQ